MKEKLLFKAVVDLSEVVYDLVGNAHNYSERTAKKMSKALTSINALLPNKKLLTQQSNHRSCR